MEQFSDKLIMTMKIIINKQEIETGQSAVLADVLSERGLDAPGMAVAVNNKLVPKADRASFVLSEGDQVVVIKAVCGG